MGTWQAAETVSHHHVAGSPPQLSRGDPKLLSPLTPGHKVGGKTIASLCPASWFLHHGGREARGAGSPAGGHGLSSELQGHSQVPRCSWRGADPLPARGCGLAPLVLLWALHSWEGMRGRAGVQSPNSEPALPVCPAADGPMGPTNVLRTSSCWVGESTIERKEPRLYCHGGHRPGRDTHTEAVATVGPQWA